MALSFMKKASLWGAFFIAFLLAFPAWADGCSKPGYGDLVDVRRVIDGDTLELKDGRRVRLIGINAPEINHRGGPSEPFAQAAKLELVRITKESQLRLLEGSETTDRYGRTLGHLFDGRGANIEALMLRAGFGFAVGIAPNLLLLDCHLKMEAYARQQRAGVWQVSPVVQASAVKSGGFSLMRGRVMKVDRAGGDFWLELDGPIVLKIDRNNQHRFENIDQWQGRSLEVRGWVVDRRGRVASRRGLKRFMLTVPDSRLISFDVSQ